ncbi:MAG TPA: AraC family transcriptional regulator [Anaerolineae bacterium]|nr:AraC family transcriptional regulator [Anaerolineae bacterium]
MTLIAQKLTTQLQIDELAIELLESVIAESFKQQGIRSQAKPCTRNIHRDLAMATQKLLTTRYHEHLTLGQIAAELFVSPYHLSRVFRQQVGCTLHHYLDQLRLRIAHEQLGDYIHNINRLALDLGYATHSHFTKAFRRNFGYPPSQSQHQLGRK